MTKILWIRRTIFFRLYFFEIIDNLPLLQVCHAYLKKVIGIMIRVFSPSYSFILPCFSSRCQYKTTRKHNFVKSTKKAGASVQKQLGFFCRFVAKTAVSSETAVFIYLRYDWLRHKVLLIVCQALKVLYDIASCNDTDKHVSVIDDGGKILLLDEMQKLLH